MGPCGFHHDLTADKSNVFTFDDHVCSVCVGAAQYARVLADQDEKSLKAMGENPPALMPRPGDGRQTFIRQLSPLEVAVRNERRLRADERDQPGDGGRERDGQDGEGVPRPAGR